MKNTFEQAYEELFELRIKDLEKFKLSIVAIPANKLSLEILLNLSVSGDTIGRNGARIVLMKRFPEKLSYVTLFEFLMSGDLEIQDHACALLNEIPVEMLRRVVLREYCLYTNLIVRDCAQKLLDKIEDNVSVHT